LETFPGDSNVTAHFRIAVLSNEVDVWPALTQKSACIVLLWHQFNALRMSVLFLEMSQVSQPRICPRVGYACEVLLSDSRAAENWEAGANPALPPQR